MTTADYKQLLRNLGRHAPHVAEPAPHSPRQPNKWECEYSAHLALRQHAGEVTYFGYEKIRLKLADSAWYKPDFLVITSAGSVELHEVKGFERPAAILRFKLAGELFPFWRFLMLTKRDGSWVVTRKAGAA